MEDIPSITYPKSGQEGEKKSFTRFPLFAKFIRENHIEEFTKVQLQNCRDVDLPLLRHLSHISEEELLQLSLVSQDDFLRSIEEGRAHERTEQVLKTWEADEMKIISKNDIAMEDIISGVFARKNSLIKFLPLYTSDIDEALAIIKEIDQYEYEVSLSSSNTYNNILKRQLEKNAHLIEKVTDTVPGAIVVFDPLTFTELYSNHRLHEIAGYEKGDLNTIGNMLKDLLHPDDIERVLTEYLSLQDIVDKEMRIVDFRIKHKNDNYIWLRTYNAIFKRNTNGSVEVIGAVFNVDKEKRNEENLIKSQEQLLEAQALAEMASYSLDLDTDKMEVTPEFLKIFEIDNLSDRKKYLDHIHPADRAKVDEARKNAIDGNGVFDCEYRYLINNKQKVIWGRGVVSVKDGKKIMNGTVMDVTSRKHMLHSLQRSELLYKQAQAMSHIGNWTWDLLQEKLDWSEEMYHIHELPLDFAIEYNTVFELIHPDDIENLRTVVRGSIDRKQPYDVQYRIITKNNKEKILHAKGQVLIDEQNKPYKVIGTLQDVTKEHLITAQLRESREFIQKIANTTPSIIASYNVNTGQYVYINSAVEKILGYSPELIMKEGLPFFNEIIHPEDREQISEQNAKAMEEANNNPPLPGEAEMIVEFKYRLKHQNGRYRWFQTYGTIFSRNSEGKVEAVLNVSIDISEREEALQQLYRKNIALEQSNTNLEEYAYVASHDLKEPLRKISTFGDRLLNTNHSVLSDDGKLYLEKIISSAKRMQTMINDLMSISTINSNKTYDTYNLTHIVKEVLSILEQKIEEKGATITFDPLPELKIVVAQFRQLFQNLLSNALKFSRDGVPLKIHISAKQLTSADLKTYNLPEIWPYVKIDVKDNGIGFESEYASRIFTIFQRLHGKSEYEGNGIGLAICKKVVENHNGIIFATSVLGEGSVFSIIVPMG